jgi:hypothetical protein
MQLTGNEDPPVDVEADAYGPIHDARLERVVIDLTEE